MNSIECVATYKGEILRIITVLFDLDVAFVENEAGEILKVKYSVVS